MSTMLDEALDAEDVAPRRRWPRVLGALVVLALIGAGIGAAVYVHTYQPLGDGFAMGAPMGAARPISDGVTDPTRFIIVGPQGSVGTVTFSIANNGRYAERILGSDVQAGQTLIVPSLRWSPLPVGSAGTTGTFASSRPFPMTLQPGQQIFLYVTITKPKCMKGGSIEFDVIGLHTEALGVHHDWDLALGGNNAFFPPIDACSPAAALKHIVKN